MRLKPFIVFRALNTQRRRLVAVKRQQQGRCRQFAAAVDTHEEQVFGVELEIQPGPAIGNHPRGKQKLARRVSLALVMIEEDARRTVHLADNHAFGAVHDEGTVARHQGHVAHVDVLFLDVANRACAGILIDIPHDQTQSDLQRRGIGNAPLLTLFRVVFWILQLVAHKLKLCALGEIPDREHRLENRFQAEISTLFGCNIHLQEIIIRRPLDFDQVRHRRDFGNSTETLADTLTPRERLRHNLKPRLIRFATTN